MALGIGILVGISMGDSALVFNQIAVIEELEGKIHSYRQQNEETTHQISILQHELDQWNVINERYVQPIFRDTLNEISLTIIAGDNFPMELLDFLEQSGCAYHAFYLTPPEQWPDSNMNLFKNEEFKGERIYDYAYGEIIWEAIRSRETKGSELLAMMANHGLLEFKRYYPVNSEADKRYENIFLLTGDIPFVSNILKKGILQRETDYSWIILNVGDPEDVNKRVQLPDNWTIINLEETFFSKIELWETLIQISEGN